MSELKPCPFCGEAAQVSYAADYRDPVPRLVLLVNCSECSLRTGIFDSKEEAVAAWNARTSAPPAQAPTAQAAPQLDADGFVTMEEHDRLYALKHATPPETAVQAVPSEPETINGEAPNAHNILAALIDIHDDAETGDPDARCYVPEAWGDTLRMARQFLATVQPVQPKAELLEDSVAKLWTAINEYMKAYEKLAKRRAAGELMNADFIVSVDSAGEAIEQLFSAALAGQSAAQQGSTDTGSTP